MTLREQIADDFAGVVADVGISATCGAVTLRGVLASVPADISLVAGGFEQEITSQFRYDPTAHNNFIPAQKAALVAAGRTFRVIKIERGGAHDLVMLGLSVS
jgi:hypothetical protein